MRNPEPPLVERLVGPFLLQGQLPTAGLLRRHQDRHLREREGQEAQILQQPTPSRERVGGGLSDAQIMHTAAVGVAQKEDSEERVDKQDIFDRSWGRTMRRSVPSWAKGGRLARRGLALPPVG